MPIVDNVTFYEITRVPHKNPRNRMKKGKINKHQMDVVYGQAASAMELEVKST